jgi:hypothetical protein
MKILKSSQNYKYSGPIVYVAKEYAEERLRLELAHNLRNFRVGRGLNRGIPGTERNLGKTPSTSLLVSVCIKS